jgi:GMP synthase (glutamine-hydrolysing)
VTSDATLVVLTTGDPAPDVHATHGPWSGMIRRAAARAHAGPFVEIDARTALADLPGDAGYVVITGSAAHIEEREPWVVATEAWLRDALERGVAVFGICFGHQLLAQALGGEVRRNPKGREFGTVEIEVTAPDPIFEGVDPRFAANVTHLDTVARLPDGARALARSSKDDHQVIRFSERCYGVQFHPEIDRDVMLDYYEARRAVLTSEGVDVDRKKPDTTHAPGAVSVLENFFHVARRTR